MKYKMLLSDLAEIFGMNNIFFALKKEDRFKNVNILFPIT